MIAMHTERDLNPSQFFNAESKTGSGNSESQRGCAAKDGGCSVSEREREI